MKITINKNIYLSKTEFKDIEELREFLNDLELEKDVSSVEEIQAEYTINKETKKMSISELNKRIDASMKNSLNDDLSNTKDLLSEIEKWD